MFNISRSMEPTLGIDISNSRVRALQLSAHKQRYRIDHIASYSLPEICPLLANCLEMKAKTTTKKSC